jgi:hypothetical protein
MELREDSALLAFLVCHYQHRLEELAVDAPAGCDRIAEAEADAIGDDPKLTALLAVPLVIASSSSANTVIRCKKSCTPWRT